MESKFNKYLEQAQNTVVVDGVEAREQDGVFLVSDYALRRSLVGSKYDNEETNAEARQIIEEAKQRNEELKKRGGFAGIPSDDYAMHIAMSKAWAKANNAYLYERDKESFDRWEAIDLAKEQGKKIIILSNLS